MDWSAMEKFFSKKETKAALNLGDFPEARGW